MDPSASAGPAPASPIPPDVAAGTSSADAAPGRRLGKLVALILGLIALGGLALAAPRLGWRWTSPTAASVESALASRQFGRAIDEAQDLLRATPNDPRLLYNLARGYMGAGDAERAVEALQKIPPWSLRKPEALFYEGKIRLAQKRGRDAEQAFRACVATGAPVADNARLELLAILAMEERFDAFKQVFWEVYPRLGASDRLPVLTMRMRLEFEQVKPELNAESLREFLAADPGDTQARAGLAAALDHAGDPIQALTLYAQALQEAPEDLSLRERYLDLLNRTGESASLRTVLAQRPAGSDDRAAIQRFLGLVAQTDGKLPEAEAAYHRSIAADPGVSETHHRLSQVLQRLGQREAAAAAAAERDRINRVRDALHKAWNDFADTFENRPEQLTADLLLGMSRACGACDLSREADAWASAARQWEQAQAAGAGTRPAPAPAPRS